MKDSQILSIGETAKLLGVSIQTLRRWDEKGTLKSFRPTPGGNRYYKKTDIDVFLDDIPALGWNWASSDSDYEPEKMFYCSGDDVFGVRLERMGRELSLIEDLGIHYSLLVSMTGEIGDNSYAHNLGNWPDIRGVFFGYDLNKRVIVLADRGRGILQTLKNIRPELRDHQEALKVAFTEIISGRFPEQRGNGLKSVAKNILNNSVKLTYVTGDAHLTLMRGDKELNINKGSYLRGCYAVLKF